MDMEQDCWAFLERFSSDELKNRGILRGSRYLLQGTSVDPLIELMKEHNVTRLVAEKRRWFLTSDGEFSNPRSDQGDIRQGRVADLRNPGDVFKGQNRYINPHFDRSQSPGVPTGSHGPSQPPTPKHPPLTADELGRMRRRLRCLMDSVEGERKEKDRSRVKRMKKDKSIPGLVAEMMFTVIEARNILEYDRESLSSREETAVRAAWEVVREWASAEGLETSLNVQPGGP